MSPCDNFDRKQLKLSQTSEMWVFLQSEGSLVAKLAVRADILLTLYGNWIKIPTETSAAWS